MCSFSVHLIIRDGLGTTDMNLNFYFFFKLQLQNLNVLNLYSLSPVELVRRKDIWLGAIFTCEVFVTSREFGVIGSLCVKQTGDKNSRKWCRWRLRYIGSDLLLHVEKLYGACNVSFCIHFRDMPFWMFQTSAFSRISSRFFHISYISRAR